MVRSPESFARDPTYLEFFGLTREPFAPLSDPDQQFQSQQHLLLMEHLEFAAANADCLLVVCGADGSGKSTLINRFMSTMRDRAFCVLVDAAACQGAVPFYSTFLQQIGFEEITGTASELGNITKEFLVCRGIARDHVLVIIDNTHVADPRILEQIRRLCDVRIKDRRAISIVLFGNADIVRVVDAPAMRNAAFANHVVFNLRSYSEHEAAVYIRHRLGLAGADDGLMFPEAVCALIHRYSGGIPQRINKLAADVLDEAHRLGSRTVSTDIVRAVINKQRLLPHLTPMARTGRRRSDSGAESRTVPEAIDFQAAQGRIKDLAAQIEHLEESRSLALRELEDRDQQIRSLRDELGVRRTEAETLSDTVASQAAMIASQRQALLDSAGVLKEREDELKRLGSGLAGELRAREAAQEQLDKAMATIAALTVSRQQLQATAEALGAELQDHRQAAEQRTAEREALEEDAAHLRAELAQRAAELESSRSELASRRAEVAELGLRLASQSCVDHASAITEQSRALSDASAALQASENRVRHLADELDNSLRSRDTALENLDKAESTVAELTRSGNELRGTFQAIETDLRNARETATQRAAEAEANQRTIAGLRAEIAGRTTELQVMRGDLASREAALADLAPRFEQLLEREQELQATVDELHAELKSSRERAFAAYALENYVAELQAALEKRTSELNAQTQAVADLEQQVTKLKARRETSRSRVAAARSRTHAPPLPDETRAIGKEPAHSSRIAALYERTLAQIPAYQRLKEHDPVFYDGLVGEYQLLVGQGLSDQQVTNRLRAIRARWLERQLARASDRTIVAYARLLVEQLDEFLLEGVEPCLAILVPQPPSAARDVPGYSRRTAERELDLLNMVVTTHDARRGLPKEDHVWPDLEPIFMELFERFGADNVAAIENSFDPNLDRSLLCNVSKTLYLRILALPEAKAAAALRWMVASK